MWYDRGGGVVHFSRRLNQLLMIMNTDTDDHQQTFWGSWYGLHLIFQYSKPKIIYWQHPPRGQSLHIVNRQWISTSRRRRDFVFVPFDVSCSSEKKYNDDQSCQTTPSPLKWYVCVFCSDISYFSELLEAGTDMQKNHLWEILGLIKINFSEPSSWGY